VHVTDEDASIMSLAENIALRGHRPLDILVDIDPFFTVKVGRAIISGRHSKRYA
jgi:hypothetical protein